MASGTPISAKLAKVAPSVGGRDQSKPEIAEGMVAPMKMMKEIPAKLRVEATPAMPKPPTLKSTRTPGFNLPKGK